MSLLRPERIVADVLRDEAGRDRTVRARRLLVARLQLAQVLAIGRGFVRGATADIFGLDKIIGDDPTLDVRP